MAAWKDGIRNHLATLDAELMTCATYVNTSMYSSIRSLITNTIDVIPDDVITQSNIDTANSSIHSMRRIIDTAKNNQQFAATLHAAQQTAPQQQPTYVAQQAQSAQPPQQQQPTYVDQHAQQAQSGQPAQQQPQPGQQQPAATYIAQHAEQSQPVQQPPTYIAQHAQQPGQQQQQQQPGQQATQHQQYAAIPHAQHTQPSYAAQQHTPPTYPAQQHTPPTYAAQQQHTQPLQFGAPSTFLAQQPKPQAGTNVDAATSTVSTTAPIMQPMQQISVSPPTKRPWYILPEDWAEMIAANPGQEAQIAASLEEDKKHWIEKCMFCIKISE